MTTNYQTRLGAWATVLLLGVWFDAPSAVAETRGYAINYIQLATHRDERNCPGGGNGNRADILKRALKSQGYSQAEIEEMLAKQGKDEDIEAELRRLTSYRGKVNGEPVPVSQYPESVPYQQLETVSGPYAYGFDLDGKGAGTANTFEDPETGRQGVDNQLFRVVGCYSVYNVNYPARPWWAENSGNDYLTEGKAPAWLFTVTAENFAEGKATVSFYRAVGHMRRNKIKKGLENLTYVVDPYSETYGEFQGVIKDGVFTSTPDDVSMRIEGGFPTYLQLSLSNAQLRLDLNRQSPLVGYLGGYQPWMDYWFYVGMVGDGYVDTGETFHALKRMADADPDPQTGENRRISSTFRIDAVPAFVVRRGGTFITSNP